MRSRAYAWTMRGAGVVLCAFVAMAPGDVRAGEQPSASPPSPTVRLDAAVDQALQNYPAIRAAAGRTEAARAGVSVARTAYLPHTDLLWQQNRATRNNVAGLLLPQNVIPAISGPVSPSTNDGVWGSAGGVLFSWEPFDFGLRRANVAAAESAVQQAAAGQALTRLQVAAHAADAFLAAVAAGEAVRAAQANVERLQVFQGAVATLVRNELRAGADASRADAELAAAKIRLYQSQRDTAVTRASLAEAIGLGGQSVTPDAGALLAGLPPPVDGTANPAAHPVVQIEQAAIETVQRRERALDHSYVPRVNLQSAVFARGAVAPDLAGRGSDGLWPDTSNWAMGLTFTFPVFDVFSTKARRRIEEGNEAAERARYDQTVQALRADDVRARAQLDAARLIAETSPVGLKAARDAEAQARARYQAGLTSITEVAEAQRLLAQADVDDAVARLGVWQALLAVASARGDLTPFLDQVKAFSGQPP